MNITVPDYDNISPTEATALQKQLREKISLQPLKKEVKLIGGADISFNKFEETVYAGIIVLSFPQLMPVASIVTIERTKFPYIPGLLAFREVPALISAWNQLTLKPDLLVLDGHGIAHKRRTGIATHFSLLANIPTIGCAKSKLTGIYTEPENHRFSQSTLTDKTERIGTVLRTKMNCKPVFVSPGNLINFEQSNEIIKQCVTSYRIPQPTRLAHNLVNEVRKTKTT